jgi:hypothetical protein
MLLSLEDYSSDSAIGAYDRPGNTGAIAASDQDYEVQINNGEVFAIANPI